MNEIVPKHIVFWSIKYSSLSMVGDQQHIMSHEVQKNVPLISL